MPGRLKSFEIGTSQDPDADYEVAYSYDASGRLNRVIGPGLDGTYGASYSRVANSDMVEYIRFKDSSGDDAATSWRKPESDRDLLDYVENVLVDSPENITLSRYEYTLDTLGHRTFVEMTGYVFEGDTGDHHWDFVYNNRSELTEGDRREGTTAQQGDFMTPGDFDYLYDPIGNRESYTLDSDEITYTTNSVNQYDLPGTPNYDGDGNLISDGEFGYSWDGENRLIAVYPGSPGEGDVKLVFDYDYMSRRVRKRVYDWDDQEEEWESTESKDLLFIYDQWNVALVLDGTQENDPVKHKYTWGLDLSGLSGVGSAAGIHGAGGIGGLLARQEGAYDYVYLYDGFENGDRFENGDKSNYAHDQAEEWETEESTDLKFVYDGWNVALVLDGTDSDAIETKYTWGLDLSGLSGNGSVSGIHGAGGSSIAITSYLMKPAHGGNRPSKIIVSNRSTPRLEGMRKIHDKPGREVRTEYHHTPNPEESDAILNHLKPHSLVINATGLGKDSPGSPITDAGVFPEHGFAWDFNYRGNLVFLDQARAQQEDRDLSVEDGWIYFVHGWTRVIAEVFDVEIPTAGPVFNELSRIATEARCQARNT